MDIRTYSQGDWSAIRLPRHVHPLLGLGALFLAYAAITTLFFWTALPHLASAVLGPPEDNLTDFWNSWYVVFEADPHHLLHTTLLRFPEGTALTYHSFAYHHILAIVALVNVFGADRETITLFNNLTTLVSFPLAGLGAFLLVKKFTGNTAASVVGGFVFAFTPWHVAQALHHAGVAEIGFVPFFLYCYLEALERRSRRWLAGAVLTCALSALSCWYYLFYFAFFMAFHGIYVWLRTRNRPRGWQLWAPAGVMAGAVILLMPLIFPMFAGVGAERGAFREGWYTFGMDLTAYVVPAPEGLFGRWTASHYARLTGNSWELAGYLGLVNLGLLAWIWWKRRDARDETLHYVLAAMITFMVLASGVRLLIGGFNTHIPMPDVVLSKLPVFYNLRTPSRCIIFVHLFLAVGVGYALSFLFHKMHDWRARGVAAGLVVLLVLDFLPVRIAMTPTACSKALDVIRDDPERGFGVLDLPKTYGVNVKAMLEQTCHGRPVVTAQISRVLAPSLMDRLALTDLAKQRQQLRAAHVKYIVLRPSPATPWPRREGSPALYLTAYQTVHRSDDLVLLKVY